MNNYHIKNIIRCHPENHNIVLRFAAYRDDVELGAFTTRGKAAMAISRAVAKDAAAAFPMPSGRIEGRLGLSL